MKKARKVRVALQRKSENWDYIASTVFSNYFFQCSSTDDLMVPEEGAKIVMEFINYDQNLLILNAIGSDPYFRPFLYLFVVDVPSEGISDSLKEEIAMWIEKSVMTASTYLVILIQDDRKFGTKNTVKPQDITTDQTQIQNIRIIKYCKTKKLLGYYIDTLREAVRDLIVDDFNKLDNETLTKISFMSEIHPLTKRIKVWRNLLIYSFGFFESALSGFSSNYFSVIKDDWDWYELITMKIDQRQIVIHPFTENNDNASIIMFALHGIMATSYSRLDFDTILIYFFKHFSLLRSRCQTDQEHHLTNEWGEAGIDSICSISQYCRQPMIYVQLLFRKILIEISENASFENVENTYLRLKAKIKKKTHSLTILETIYIQFLKKQNKPIVHLKVQPFIGWDIITNSANIIFQNAINQGNYDLAFSTAKSLLSDRSKINNKKEIFMNVINCHQNANFNTICHIFLTFSSQAFKSEIPAGNVFDLEVKCKYPFWFPIEFDKSTIKMKRINKKAKFEVHSSSTFCLKDVIKFQMYLRSSGIWQIESFSLHYRNITLIWPIDNGHQIIIGHHQNIPIHADFPRILNNQTRNIASVYMDFSQTMTKFAHFKLEFNNKFASIPNQNCKLIINPLDVEIIDKINIDRMANEEYIPIHKDQFDKYSFEIIDGNILFNSQFDPSLKKLKFLFKYDINDFEGTETSLVIISTVNHHKWKSIFKTTFSFPIDISLRLINDHIIHIVLTNTSDTILTLLRNNDEKVFFGPNKKHYILHSATNKTLSITALNDHNEKTTKVWNLEQIIPIPKIDAILSSSSMIHEYPSLFQHNSNIEKYYLGEIIDLQFSLPECNYKLIPNENIIVIGVLEQFNFTGGRVDIKIIPIASGRVKTPRIVINEENYVIQPQFVNIFNQPALSYGPFLLSDTIQP